MAKKSSPHQSELEIPSIPSYSIPKVAVPGLERKPGELPKPGETQLPKSFEDIEMPIPAPVIQPPQIQLPNITPPNLAPPNLTPPGPPQENSAAES